MMWVNKVRNVNEALGKGLAWCANLNGYDEPSRNGPVRVSRTPVMTVYEKPWERVLFSPLRDANPFFHLFESLWMLAGRNDLPWLLQFNKNMASYSDDGGATQPAAYGYRWRQCFGYDQLDGIVEELKTNPTTRRCVLAMWDSGGYELLDGGAVLLRSDMIKAARGSADVPCNTHCYFRIHHNQLDMTVMCRSNDIYWGAYGANAVHFSVLLEYMASRVGVQVGTLYQLSNNFHYYPEIVGDYECAMKIAYDTEASNYYVTHRLEAMPMFGEDIERWHLDLAAFMATADINDEGSAGAFEEPFFQHVAYPMLQAWRAHKAKDYAAAERYAIGIYASDWRMACTGWLSRRAIKYRETQDGA